MEPIEWVTIDPLIVALVGLLLLYAFLVLGHYMVAVPLSWIPGVGGQIGNAVDGALGAVSDRVLGWARAIVHPIAKVIGLFGRSQMALWDAASGAITQLAGAIAHITYTSLHDLSVQIVGNAAVLAQQAEGAAEQYADAAVAAAFQGMNQIINAQIGNVLGDVTSVGNTVAATAQALESQITDTAIGLNQEIVRATQGLEQALAGEAQRAEQAEAALAEMAQSAGAAALAESERIINGATGALHAEELARDAAIAAAAAAATAAVAADLTNFLDECGNDLCNNLGPLARLLPQLLGLLEDGLLLGVVAEAFLHPEQAARAADAVVGGIVDDARGILGAFGVR